MPESDSNGDVTQTQPKTSIMPSELTAAANLENVLSIKQFSNKPVGAVFTLFATDLRQLLSQASPEFQPTDYDPRDALLQKGANLHTYMSPSNVASRGEET